MKQSKNTIGKAASLGLGTTFLIATTVLIGGCGGGGGGSSPTSPAAPTQFTQTVSTTGATAQTVAPSQYPNLKLVFDPGSLGGAGTLPLTVQSVTPAVSAPQGQGVAPGTTFDFGPTGTTFTTPVHVTVTYDPTKLAPGTQQSTLKLETLQNGAWSTSGITNNAVNTTTHTITADVSHFSTFGALATIINQFAGTYSGTYQGSGPGGAFIGTVDTLTVNADGTLTAVGDGGQETGTGTVSPTGLTTLTANGTGGTTTGVSFTFAGAFQLQNGVASASGTFTTSQNEHGTWTVTRGGTGAGGTGTNGSVTLNATVSNVTGVPANSTLASIQNAPNATGYFSIPLTESSSGAVGNGSVQIYGSNQSAGANTRNFDITISDSSVLSAGTYQLGQGVGLGYTEQEGTSQVEEWAATGGTVMVTTTGPSTTIQLQNITMIPARVTGGSPNNATGTFTLSGTIQ